MRNSLFVVSRLGLALLFMVIAACASTHMQTNVAAARINAQLSLTYLQLHDPEQAKAKILLAQQQAPHEPAVWYSQAYLLEQTGQPAQAEAAYLKAIALDHKNGAAHNNYGAFLCRQGRYQSAIQQFLLAIADPNYLQTANAYHNAGVCALKIPDEALANQFFQQAGEGKEGL
jgi:type IV pilus assembly protein PilF